MDSTILVTKADGSKFEEILYKSFGEIYKFWKENAWHEPGTEDFTEIGSYAFTGQELDSETGLYYYGARYYNPNIGRFISADSSIDGIFTTQGFNRYTYAQNNPINYTDPNGNFWFLALLIIVIVPSVTSTVINTINNGAFTPTLGINVAGFNLSVAYNTKTGDTTVSGGYMIGIGPGIGLGVNISVSFDKNGHITGGSVGIGVNFSKGGFGAGLGIGANFNGDGKYTGFSVNASAGYTAGGKTSLGGSLNGAYTWNKDGTQSSSYGTAINGGYGFSSASVGLNYNSDGTYTGSGSYGYAFDAAKEYEEQQKKTSEITLQQGEGNSDVVYVSEPEKTDADIPGKDRFKDLGYVGNNIRNQVNGFLEKDLFTYFWTGKGESDYYLSEADFNYILANGKLEGQRSKISENLSVQTINCYGNKYLDQGIGVGTIYFDNKTGKAVGFKDTYDFDPKPLGVRPKNNFYKAERDTQLVYYASKIFGNSKSFDIRYGRIK